MKNKKLFAIIAAAAISAQASVIGFAEPCTLTVDGKAVEEEIILRDDATMLPLRAMAEAIGYTVSWQAESGTAVLSGISDDIFVKPVSATARSAEKNAEIYNDKTYVPIEFVNEVLGLAYDVDENNGNINIYVTEELAAEKSTVTVNSVEEGKISVNDENIGEVILMISEETEISKDGEKTEFSEIKEGDKLAVLYSPAMTMSLPPQCTAVSIEILSENNKEEQNENVSFDGEVLEITEDGMVVVSSENYKNGIALKITENTRITHSVNKRIYKAEDLEVGMKISGEHSAAMTRSIPPQTEAFSIVIK